jgi:hypothetical protein
MSTTTLYRVYPCGYSRNASLIHSLMERDEKMLLIDTRYRPRSRHPAWNEAALRARYGKRYRWAGLYLGNKHYKTGGQVTLANPETGIRGLMMYLCEGHPCILLCGCAQYAECHLRVIVELLQAALPTVQVVQPEEVREESHT